MMNEWNWLWELFDTYSWLHDQLLRGDVLLPDEKKIMIAAKNTFDFDID